MKKVSIGPCPICGINVWKYKRLPLFQLSKEGIKINFGKRPYELNKNGEHFWILETTGSRMMVAICKQCKATLTDEKVKRAYADIIYTKLEALKDIKDKNRKAKLFDVIRTKEVWAWAGSEAEIVQILNGVKNG